MGSGEKNGSICSISLTAARQSSSSRPRRRRCRDSVTLLLDEAADLMPQSKKLGVDPMGKKLVSGKETPCLRHKYRLQ